MAEFIPGIGEKRMAETRNCVLIVTALVGGVWGVFVGYTLPGATGLDVWSWGLWVLLVPCAGVPAGILGWNVGRLTYWLKRRQDG